MSETKTLGVATNSIVRSLLNRDMVLADFGRRAELEHIEDSAYYPMSLYSELCDYLEQRLGVYAFLRLGRRVGSSVVQTSFPPHVKSLEEAFTQLAAAHHAFCRPVIGALVITAYPGRLTIRYTAPYNCILQEGLFHEVAVRYGPADATVTHAECRRKGPEACLFEVRH